MDLIVFLIFICLGLSEGYIFSKKNCPKENDFNGNSCTIIPICTSGYKCTNGCCKRRQTDPCPSGSFTVKEACGWLNICPIGSSCKKRRCCKRRTAENKQTTTSSTSITKATTTAKSTTPGPPFSCPRCKPQIPIGGKCPKGHLNIGACSISSDCFNSVRCVNGYCCEPSIVEVQTMCAIGYTDRGSCKTDQECPEGVPCVNDHCCELTSPIYAMASCPDYPQLFAVFCPQKSPIHVLLECSTENPCSKHRVCCPNKCGVMSCITLGGSKKQWE